MIICPNCKEEIEDDSRYCDQCGQELSFCEKCGRVGIGRRCTSCGGLMIAADEYHRRMDTGQSVSSSGPSGYSYGDYMHTTNNASRPAAAPSPQQTPQLMLYNDSLNIRIVGINGAVIGRRQGPYVQFFQQNMYVSGVHAQLSYRPGMGWSIADRHSSNGTKLNGHIIQPDVDMSIKTGDTITIANVNLQVNVS